MQVRQSHGGPEVDIEEFAKLVKQPNMVFLSHIPGVRLCVCVCDVRVDCWIV